MNSSKTLKNGTIRDSKLRSETDKSMFLKNVEKKTGNSSSNKKLKKKIKEIAHDLLIIKKFLWNPIKKGNIMLASQLKTITPKLLQTNFTYWYGFFDLIPIFKTYIWIQVS